MNNLDLIIEFALQRVISQEDWQGAFIYKLAASNTFIRLFLSWWKPEALLLPEKCLNIDINWVVYADISKRNRYPSCFVLEDTPQAGAYFLCDLGETSLADLIGEFARLEGVECISFYDQGWTKEFLHELELQGLFRLSTVFDASSSRTRLIYGRQELACQSCRFYNPEYALDSNLLRCTPQPSGPAAGFCSHFEPA